MKFLFSRRGLAALAVLVLALFLFRPGMYRLRIRIANSIGSALGRKVTLDNVHLRILPRPGFDLEGLVIYDGPAFGAEPMIRAQEVSAAIRLRPLLRGRLEIATLSASEPSVNLVRNNQGRWNLASLLERNAQIPVAPTGKSASARRPAFPYLEASGARINFKLGQTKKSYALMNADVALWQESENSWSARIKAEPVRTDFNLTDTGLVQIDATWQRAPSAKSTPVRIAAQWQYGQLGQITKLLSGKDRGWRGGVGFTAKASGTPEALRIEGQAAIEGFRRYDIVGSESVRLGTFCLGQYNAIASEASDLLCESSASGGILRLQGAFSLAAQPPAYDLTFEAERVPIESLVRLLRQAKKQIPGDLTATGLLNAEFRATRNIPIAVERGLLANGLQTQILSGSGAASNVRLSSKTAKNEIAFGAIPLAFVATGSPDASERGKPGHSRTQEQQKDQEPAEPHLRIGPVALTTNAAAPVSAGGWISAAGYRFFLRGDVELKDLFHLEDTLGLPLAHPAAEGAANFDVSVSGAWQGFSTPAALGTAQLRNVHAEMRGLNTPVEIASAAMDFTPDAVSMQKISARVGSTHWSGGVTAPRHCAAPNCVFQFDLTAGQLFAADLAEWFTPHPAKRPWYRILSSNSNDPRGTSPLLAIRARGSLHVGRFGWKRVFANQVATAVEVDRGKVTLTDLRGQLLQGTHRGDWTIDVSTEPARYHGAGALSGISLEQLGALMNDAWIAGTADGKFDVEGSGGSFRDLLARSDGKLQFAMRNGSLLHVEIPGAPAPLPVHRFTGELRLRKGAWELSAGRLESRDGLYRVSGTASPSRSLDFVLTRGDEQSWTLTGTLAKPRVAPVLDTELNSTKLNRGIVTHKKVSRKKANRAEADSKTVKP